MRSDNLDSIEDVFANLPLRRVKNALQNSGSIVIISFGRRFVNTFIRIQWRRNSSVVFGQRRRWTSKKFRRRLQTESRTNLSVGFSLVSAMEYESKPCLECILTTHHWCGSNSWCSCSEGTSPLMWFRSSGKSHRFSAFNNQERFVRPMFASCLVFLIGYAAFQVIRFYENYNNQSRTLRTRRWRQVCFFVAAFISCKFTKYLCSIYVERRSLSNEPRQCENRADHYPMGTIH